MLPELGNLCAAIHGIELICGRAESALGAI
jgi:hypothetical protein